MTFVTPHFARSCVRSLSMRLIVVRRLTHSDRARSHCLLISKESDFRAEVTNVNERCGSFRESKPSEEKFTASDVDIRVWRTVGGQHLLLRCCKNSFGHAGRDESMEPPHASIVKRLKKGRGEAAFSLSRPVCDFAHHWFLSFGSLFVHCLDKNQNDVHVPLVSFP